MRTGDSRKAGSSLLLLCLPLPVRQAQAPAPYLLALGRQLLIYPLQPLAHQLLICLLAGDSCTHSQQAAAAPISYVFYDCCLLLVMLCAMALTRVSVLFCLTCGDSAVRFGHVTLYMVLA